MFLCLIIMHIILTDIQFVIRRALCLKYRCALLWMQNQRVICWTWECETEFIKEMFLSQKYFKMWSLNIHPKMQYYNQQILDLMIWLYFKEQSQRQIIFSFTITSQETVCKHLQKPSGYKLSPLCWFAGVRSFFPVEDPIILPSIS